MGPTGPTKKTDCGTVIFHWTWVACLAVAVATGLRIATETPAHGWLGVFDFLLPKAAVWIDHLYAAVLLVSTSIAYGVYVWTARLGARLRFDRARLWGLVGRRYARWGAINVALCWLFFLALLTEFVTGTLMYLGQAGDVMVRAHWFGMWTILGYVVFHVFSQWRYGGAKQLLRILRPARLVPPPPPLEIADVLALLDGQNDQPLAAGRQPPADMQTGYNKVALNAFVAACVAACLTSTMMVASGRQIVDTLRVHLIDRSQAPVVDGETSDPIWGRIPPIYVLTEGGDNFGGTGETRVSIRAVHDGSRAYFLFVWDDPTRSLKQLPLQKSGRHWRLLHDGYERGDEHAYDEDKLAVLLTGLDTILAGDTTFHAGAAPLPGEPPSLSGRGLHYTTHAGMIADVWQWKATSTNQSNHCDDDYFGPPIAATSAQRTALVPYRGGFAHDPGTADYQNNFKTTRPDGYADLRPLRLPKDLSAMTAALGRVDLDPGHSESQHARWYMTDEESVPYSPEADRLVPDGTVIPGVLISGKYSGDRAAVTCAGRWNAGQWALEVTRLLDDHSAYHVPIRTGTLMRLAAFDHAQIRHTRHVLPLHLEVQ